jgi:TolB-like protein
MRFQFGDHVLNPERRELLRGDAPVPVEPQVFDLLLHLVQHRDRVVSKDELIATVWNGRIVSDAAIDSRVRAARQAVGDSGATQSLIRTSHRKGLRFVGTVTEIQPAEAVPPRPGYDRPSIAVLAFDNPAGDPENEYFGDGMVEEITTALSKVRWFVVISRGSSFVYKGQPIDPRQVGRDLGVRYVVQGSVRKSGHRIRVTARLIESDTGSSIWAERYDRDIGDLFAVQDEITERIVAAMEPRLHAAEYVRSHRKPPDNLDAWECVMRAMTLAAQATQESFRTAETLCRRAVALEPGYSQAHSLLAWILIRRGSNSGRMPVVLEDAAREAQIAISLDEQDPWAHLAQGFVRYRSRRHSESARAFGEAIELNPNLALAHAAIGPVLALLGDVDTGIAHVERALRLSPGDRFLGFFGALCMTITLFVAARYGDAAEWAHKLMRLRPEFPEGTRWLAAAEGMRGDLPAAASALSAHLRLVPDFTIAWAAMNQPLDGDAAERYLAGLRKAGLTEA